MKKLIFLLLAAASFSANASCTLHTQTNDTFSAMLNQKGGWDFANYNTVCEKLKKANASVEIVTVSTVLSNRSVAWAVLTVRDRHLNIMATGYNGVSTVVNDFASQDKANAETWPAVRAAFEAWDTLDQAIAELEKARKAIRKARLR